jgi:hypothetical protein
MMEAPTDAGGQRKTVVGESLDPKKRDAIPTTPKVHAQVAAAQVSDVLSLLLAFRFINALCVRTFFQPDEYFQALEPAWDIAFGANSGAWLTWVHCLIPNLSSSSISSCSYH